MTAVIDRIVADLKYPWWVTDERDRRIVISRWLNKDTRQDVTIVLDAARRVECVSVWENRRVSIDCDPGRRLRLEAFLADFDPYPVSVAVRQ